MNKCEECGKRLRIFHTYCHPTLGKNHTVCSNCFDMLSESVQRWTDFILFYADFFQKSARDRNLNFNWKNIGFAFIQTQKLFNNDCSEKIL